MLNKRDEGGQSEGWISSYFDTKIGYILGAVWFLCLSSLFGDEFSIFFTVPVCVGTILSSLLILCKGTPMRVAVYIALPGALILSLQFPLLKELRLHDIFFFLPLLVYADDNNGKELPFLPLLTSSVSFFLMRELGFSVPILLIVLMEAVVCFLLSAILSHCEELKKRYDDFYYTKNHEERMLKKVYKSLLSEQDGRVENAILSERNRISRDIHDSLGHLTSRGILQIGAMLVTEKDEKKREALASLKATLSEGMKEVRASLHNFQNESLSLKGELEKLVSDFSFCKADFTYSASSEFPLKFKYSVIFIVKEALTNIGKHSNATRAEIGIVEMKDKIYLKISDNGENPKLNENGMGLYSIRKRAEELGGRAEISTDKGFRIFITIDKAVST